MADARRLEGVHQNQRPSRGWLPYTRSRLGTSRYSLPILRPSLIMAGYRFLLGVDDTCRMSFFLRALPFFQFSRPSTPSSKPGPLVTRHCPCSHFDLSSLLNATFSLCNPPLYNNMIARSPLPRRHFSLHAQNRPGVLTSPCSSGGPTWPTS